MTDTPNQEGVAREGGPEVALGPVTIYYVTRSWRGQDLPEVTAFTGTRTRMQIKLDRSPGYGRTGGPSSSTIRGRELDRVHLTPLAAAKDYRERTAAKSANLHSQLTEAQRHSANALRLLDQTKAWTELHATSCGNTEPHEAHVRIGLDSDGRAWCDGTGGA